MKRILLLAFLFAAGIVFSQTGPQPGGLSAPEIPPGELPQSEPDSGELSQGESDYAELSELEPDTAESEEDSEELAEDDDEKLLAEEDSSVLPSSDDLLISPSSDPVKSPASRTGAANQTTAAGPPQWAKDLRRGEIIAFGAFPIAVFFSRMFVDLYRTATHNWDRRYAPWPATAAGAISMTESELKMSFGIAASVSVLIAVADHLIVKHKRKKAAAAEQ